MSAKVNIDTGERRTTDIKVVNREGLKVNAQLLVAVQSLSSRPLQNRRQKAPS